MLEFDVEMSREGMTVPYAPIFDEIRRNYGFVDVRGRPDLAAKIPEGSKSSAMGKLLGNLSGLKSPLFTIGCDLGAKAPDHDATLHTAGGYIQVMSTKYASCTPDDYTRFAFAIAKRLRAKSRDYNWKIQFVLTPVRFKLDNFNEMTGSLWVWFHALSDQAQHAMNSREALLTALDKALAEEELH
ncbi:hypothetical protein [Taklimakanibacter albus]|uniref:Uncharacterized protein n=1 Tax=Taklimakanibacter albus TaxID=2800327 RepID=A0ACC5QZG3_9HYPH|nr:hypothetical protein [Aestuariivirga sp. YIM B02566]MBK1865794.1 hypothetical protein [Aestuariivirga sp. YIM B02566]